MTTFWLAILFCHLLAMAFFVGGQILLVGAIVPVERGNPDPARMRAMARRFGIGSLIALVILAGTGIAMAFHLHLWDSAILQTKLGLVVLVLILTALHMRFPRAHALSGVIFLATLAIVWLGLDLTR
ncbi:MAG TPA: hypothetical protein VFD37_05595 [Solirubrobacterales bacterium]|nr:hypothetical protein [Solirubrobacterales bacterium]